MQKQDTKQQMLLFSDIKPILHDRKKIITAAAITSVEKADN